MQTLFATFQDRENSNELEKKEEKRTKHNRIFLSAFSILFLLLSSSILKIEDLEMH